MTMLTHVTINVSVWDNDLTHWERQDVLLFAEHAARKTATWGGIQYWVTDRDGMSEVIHFRWNERMFLLMPNMLRKFYHELNRLHYVNRDDEPVVAEWHYKMEEWTGA